MIKKLALCFIILVCVFFGYKWLFPSLENQLFKAIKEKCLNQKNCMIHLHEITPFKWDKAYFFPSGNNYSNQEIQNITGVTGNFQRNNTLVIFTDNNRLVKYATFNDLSEEDDSYTPTNLSIIFSVDKDILREMNYTGDVNNFTNLTDISYYEITKENDKLYSWCVPEKYFRNPITQCLINFTNINQIHLYNPKKKFN